LINGSSTKEFRPKRGFRQGDPLTPFLFLIAAEGLAGLVREASRIGVLEGVKVGHNSIDVKLLQFADDTFSFANLSSKALWLLKRCFAVLKLVMALKLTFTKAT